MDCLATPEEDLAAWMLFLYAKAVRIRLFLSLPDVGSSRKEQWGQRDSPLPSSALLHSPLQLRFALTVVQ